MKFDDVLRETGEFGRYQVFLFALFCCPICIFISYVIFGQLFMTLEPEHWCHVPQLDGLNLTEWDRRRLGVPAADECRMYDVNYSQWIVDGHLTINEPDDRWPTVPCRHGWVYNFTDLYPTAVSEWDWVCEDSWKPYAAQSIFFVGCSVGCFFLGLVADMFGRVPALFVANGIACAAGVATAFSRGFVTFVVFRFLAGMSFNTCFLVYYIIVLEYTGPSKRTLVSNISFGIFHCASAVLIPWVAYAIWDWRLFAIVTAAPIGIVLPLCFVIPESASWLITKGKIDKAIRIVEEVARFNKRHLSAAVVDDLRRKLKETEPVQGQKKYTLLDVLRKTTLRKRALIMFLVWFLISLCADGHARNTHNLGYNIYYTFSASSATQLPAAIVVLLTLDKIGRRWSAFSSLAIGGVVCLSIAAVPHGRIAMAGSVVGPRRSPHDQRVVQHRAAVRPGTAADGGPWPGRRRHSPGRLRRQHPQSVRRLPGQVLRGPAFAGVRLPVIGRRIPVPVTARDAPREPAPQPGRWRRLWQGPGVFPLPMLPKRGQESTEEDVQDGVDVRCCGLPVHVSSVAFLFIERWGTVHPLGSVVAGTRLLGWTSWIRMTEVDFWTKEVSTEPSDRKPVSNREASVWCARKGVQSLSDIRRIEFRRPPD